ncbi:MULTISPECIES: hypothetical protein [Streptomyces]|uniref:hypothetical protein n=1 Tax=Streptomyces TaxID=1883 RepID=UPI0029AA2B49|nr:hypothetical protein [Streptomyces sp. FL07-04A]MDX3577715.1 hypothetical protein [Streptomyces sp. FL07-04A]
MRLRTPCPATARAWTVELRSHSGGITLFCPNCPHGGGRVNATTARAAALAHLARHARTDLRAAHLRICQCHERGCRWHPRHRGCAGPVRLLLARERGGLVWRLADACTACAAATEQAAVVPDTLLVSPQRPRGAARRRRRQVRGPGDRVRVAEMLSYLAAALPQGVSAAARLVALQCALRMDSRMCVRLPVGVLRSLRLNAPRLWRELEEARWLRIRPSRPGEVTAELLDSALLAQYPSRPDRQRAADWALRAGRTARAFGEGPHTQLLSLYISALSDPATGQGQGEVSRIRHECVLEEHDVLTALDRLAVIGSFEWWRVCPDTGDVQWSCTTARQRGR